MRIDRTQHANLDSLMKYLSSHVVKTGFFDTAKYDDGTPVAYVAAQNEFGHPAKNIPSRPFFRNAIKANEQKWESAAGQLIASVIEGNLPKEQALEQLGQLMKGDIQESIIDGEFEPLKQSTLDARQSRKRTEGVSKKPLIDSGHMMRSVDYVVEKK